MPVNDKQEYPAEIVCGITKKMAMELEKLPLETHQCIVHSLAQLFQHRAMAEQNRLQREQLEREEKERERVVQQQAAQQKRDQELHEHIERSKPKLVPVMSADPTEPQKLIEVPAGVTA